MLSVHLICKYVISITINAKQRASRRIILAVWTSAHTHFDRLPRERSGPRKTTHSTGPIELAQCKRLFETLKNNNDIMIFSEAP